MDRLPLDDPRRPFEQTARRGRSLRVLVALSVAVVFLAAAVLKPWGAPSRPGSTPVPLAVSTGTAASSLAPVDDARQVSLAPPCGSGRLVVTTAGLAPPPPVPDVPDAGSGKVAYAIAEGSPGTPDDRRVIVVADVSGSHVAGFVSSVNGVGDGWVSLRGWSADGSFLLVEVGRTSLNVSEVHGTCSDLFLVRSDGTEVDGVTDNGPGERVLGAAFVEADRTVVWVEAVAAPVGSDMKYKLTLQAVHLFEPLRLAGLSCTLGAGALEFNGVFAVAPDRSRIAMLCDDGVRTVDVATSRSVLALPSTSGPHSAVGWGTDGQHLAAVVDSPPAGAYRLTIEQAGWQGGQARRINSSSVAAWMTRSTVTSFSPDGTRLLTEACSSFPPSDCQQQLVVIDIPTGMSHVVYESGESDSELDARWLPDGREIAIGRNGATGSAVFAADGSGFIRRSDLPPDAAWWSPA